MKKKLSAAVLLFAVSVICFAACTPQSGSPDTLQPQTGAGDGPATSEPVTEEYVPTKPVFYLPQAEPPSPPVETVTPENVSEVFLPSLQCYVYYMGSYVYDIERDDILNPEEYTSNWYKVEGYSDFESMRDELRIFLSDSIIDEIKMNGIYRELFGMLFINVEGSNDSDVYDVTSFELLESEGDTYVIAVDHGTQVEFGDDIYTIDRLIFTTTLKDGVLHIDSVEQGPTYTAEQIKAGKSPMERKWMSHTDKIFRKWPWHVPFSDEIWQ